MSPDRYKSPTDTGTVVMSYYPLGGNAGNTGPRYQSEADLTGFDVVGIPRIGSDTFHISPRLRHRLTVEHFDELCADNSTELDQIAQDYDTVIWRGQSTGSFPTLSVVKNKLARATHLVLEDGINLRQTPDGKPVSALRGRKDWYDYNKDEGAHMPHPEKIGWEKPEGKPQSKLGTAVKFIVEQYHWAPLWRSLYTRDTTLEIADSQKDLPIFIKFLGHSATASEAQIQQMQNDLEAALVSRQASALPSADIMVKYDPRAWHGFLLYPQFGAANLMQAAQMESLVDA